MSLECPASLPDTLRDIWAEVIADLECDIDLRASDRTAVESLVGQVAMRSPYAACSSALYTVARATSASRAIMATSSPAWRPARIHAARRSSRRTNTS